MISGWAFVHSLAGSDPFLRMYCSCDFQLEILSPHILTVYADDIGHIIALRE